MRIDWARWPGGQTPAVGDALSPGRTARPRRNGCGTAFSPGFGAHAKTNSTPFDDTVALTEGSAVRLRPALTRASNTDRGDKKRFMTPGVKQAAKEDKRIWIVWASLRGFKSGI